MLEEATAVLDGLTEPTGATVSMFRPGWHAGVVGLIASRVRERVHRPAICFSRIEQELRGSGRSIPGFHLRDALDLVSKREPGLILRFGGHAQAAGLTILEKEFARFERVFEDVAMELLPEAARGRVVETDGALEAGYHSLDIAQLLENQIWGQGFPPPVFCDEFVVENQRVVGERHLKLKLRKDGARMEAMRFNSLQPLPGRMRAAYRVGINEFNGLKTVQLTVEHAEPA